MKIVDVFLIAKDTFRSNPLRTFLTVGAVTIGIGSMLFLLSFGNGLEEITIKRISTSESLRLLQVTTGASEVLNLNDETLKTFEAIPQVDVVSPRRSFTAFVSYKDVTTESVVHGIRTKHKDLEIKKIAIGAMFVEDRTDQTMITTALAKLLGVQDHAALIGEDIHVELYVPKGTTGEFSKIGKTYEVVGVVEAEDDNYAYADLASFGEEADAVDYNTVKVIAKTSDDLVPTRSSLQALGFTVESPADTISEVQTVFNVAKVVLILFGAIALVVASIGMFNTLTISLLERTHDIGIMKAIGATNRDILAVFLTEAAILGFFGGVGGIVLGSLASFGMNQSINLIAQRFK